MIHLQDLVAEVQAALESATPEERLDFLEKITEDFCRYCGGDYLPCFCIRDK